MRKQKREFLKRGSLSQSAWGGATQGMADRKTTMGGFVGDKEKEVKYKELDRCAFEIKPGKNDLKKFYQWTSAEDLSLKIRAALEDVEKFEFDVFNL